MLSKTEFDAWCCRLSLSLHRQNLIEKIRSSEPFRRVGGRRKNFSGRYPSRKMEVTIQFESHRIELPTVYEFEHDEDVLEVNMEFNCKALAKDNSRYQVI